MTIKVEQLQIKSFVRNLTLYFYLLLRFVLPT